MPPENSSHPQYRSLLWKNGKWDFRKAVHKRNVDLCKVAWCRNLVYLEWRKRGRKDGTHTCKVSRHSYCTKCAARRWRANNPEKAAFKDLRNSAAKRGIPFRLSFSRFLELCKESSYLTEKGKTSQKLHIDRIDNRRGYENDNVRVVTAAENVSKGNWERWYAPNSFCREEEEPAWLTDDCPF